ncbi:hypothetical protein [Streptomyces sp. NPDC096030]|uniref:DUF6197 family protein n=1 Tax=Streptomyces sp. NPDC096030 TaxID=3155423 RepID=UPI00332A0CE4
MTSGDDLLAAAAYLEVHGWHQGASYAHPGAPSPGETPPACALGALRLTLRSAEWVRFQAARQRLGQYLFENRLLPFPEETVLSCELEPAHLIPSWNDQPAQTREDVILALKRAASRL